MNKDNQRLKARNVITNIVNYEYANNIEAIEYLLQDNIVSEEYLSNPYLCIALVRSTYSYRHLLPSYQYILDTGYESILLEKGRDEVNLIFSGLPVSTK